MRNSYGLFEASKSPVSGFSLTLPSVAVTTVKCRIEKGMKEIQGPNGQSLLANYKVILGAAIRVDPRDKITLPKEYGTRDSSGDFETISPPILQYMVYSKPISLFS